MVILRGGEGGGVGARKSNRIANRREGVTNVFCANGFAGNSLWNTIKIIIFITVRQCKKKVPCRRSTPESLVMKTNN